MFNMFLRSTSIIEGKLPSSFLGGKLTQMQLAMIEELDKTFEFQGIIKSMETEEGRWMSFIDSSAAENCVPEIWRANI